MHAPYGWTAAGTSPCSQDIRPTAPRKGTIPLWVPPLSRLPSGACSAAVRMLSSQRPWTPMPCPHKSRRKNYHLRPWLVVPFPSVVFHPFNCYIFSLRRARHYPPRGMWHVRFDLVEANILARDQNGDDSLLFDFELTRANLALQYGLME